MPKTPVIHRVRVDRFEYQILRLLSSAQRVYRKPVDVTIKARREMH